MNTEKRKTPFATAAIVLETIRVVVATILIGLYFLRLLPERYYSFWDEGESMPIPYLSIAIFVISAVVVYIVAFQAKKEKDWIVLPIIYTCVTPFISSGSAFVEQYFADNMQNYVYSHSFVMGVIGFVNFFTSAAYILAVIEMAMVHYRAKNAKPAIDEELYKMYGQEVPLE